VPLTARSGRLQLLKLGFQPLPEAGLHQATELIHKIPLRLPDGAGTITITPHQTGSLELTELAADVRLRKTGGVDQGGHIGGPLLDVAEQLQPGRLTQQPKELAVFHQ
jgi:hypothetical protein